MFRYNLSFNYNVIDMKLEPSTLYYRLPQKLYSLKEIKDLAFDKLYIIRAPEQLSALPKRRASNTSKYSFSEF